MADKLIQVLKDSFHDQVVDQVSRHIDADASRTKAGIAAIIPTVLACILGRNATGASSPKWWTQVTDLFKDEAGSDLSTAFLETPAFKSAEAHVSDSMFGNNLSPVISKIAGISGLNKAQTEKLLKIAVPLIVGYLIRWMSDKGWSFGNLLRNLSQNRSFIMKSLPTGLNAALLGLTSVDPAKMTQRDATKAAAEPGAVKTKKGCGLLMFGFLGLVATFWFLSR